MEDWIDDERRRRKPSFSSALLDAISRATDGSQDEVSTHPLSLPTKPLSLPNKPKLGIYAQDPYTRREHLSFKYNTINALQTQTVPSFSSAGDRRHCCCNSSSCKWRNVATSTSHPRTASALQGAEVMPKVKEPKLKPTKAMSPGSRLASILNSVLVSSWSKSKSQREELKGVSDCASNSSSSSHSLLARSMSSTSSTLHKPKSKDQHVQRPSKSSDTPPSYHTKPKSKDQHVERPSKSSDTPPSYHTKPKSKDQHVERPSKSTDTPPSYHTKHKSSSSSSASVSANKEKNGKIRRWVIFEKKALASSLRNYSTKVDNSRHLDEEDAGSDSSSDLFELNSIYSRDLPVYETTHLETNKAIAKGLL